MIKAYRAGVPGNSKPFPDGSKMAKFIGTPKRVRRRPSDDRAGHPARHRFHGEGQQKILVDGNWGYAQFNYDGASNTFKPEGTGSDCGYSCHTIVEAERLRFHHLWEEVNHADPEL